MQTLILPGYSPTNKKWVDEVAGNLKIDGIIRPFYWMHWSDKSSYFDSQEKADLIVKHIKEGKMNIIAKSIGILVALKILSKNPERIEKLILCGIPTNSLKIEDLDFIKTTCLINKNKITIIQNINDPYGNFEKIKDFGEVIVKDADDHNYFYHDDFQRLMG